MANLSTQELKQEYEFLNSKRRRLVDELNNTDTELIGIKIELDNRKEKEFIQTSLERSLERAVLWDDES